MGARVGVGARVHPGRNVVPGRIEDGAPYHLQFVHARRLPIPLPIISAEKAPSRILDWDFIC